MIVGYKRYLSFLINGLQSSYRDNLTYIKEDLIFDFEQYVLSQVHLGVICHLYKRNLYVIHSVYRHLILGAEVDQQDLEEVLGWFYFDMAMFIRSISATGHLTGVGLSLVVPLGLEERRIEFVEESEKVLATVESEDISAYSKYLNLKFNEMVNFKSLFYSEMSMNRFILSVILERFSQENKGKILVIEGVVPCH